MVSDQQKKTKNWFCSNKYPEKILLLAAFEYSKGFIHFFVNSWIFWTNLQKQGQLGSAIAPLIVVIRTIGYELTDYNNSESGDDHHGSDCEDILIPGSQRKGSVKRRISS